MAYTFDSNLVSDLHKDAFGTRPSADYMDMWHNGLSDEGRQAEWDYLLLALDRAIEEEQYEERLALKEFDKEVLSVMEVGRCDEQTALAWMTPLEFEENPNLNKQDVEHWVWSAGILFTERGKEIVKTVCQIYGVK